MNATPVRPTRAIAALTAALIALTACSTSSDTASGDDGEEAIETRTFTAQNGEVEIPVEPQRIIALSTAPDLLEYGAPVVGVSETPHYLLDDEDVATYESLPVVASAAELNYEAIAELNPDLIISGIPELVFNESVDEDRLRLIAPTLSLGPLIPSDWKELNERIADAAGFIDEFTAYKDAYDTRAAEIHDQHREFIENGSFAALTAFDTADEGQYTRQYAGSWDTNIAEDAGLTFPGEGGDLGWSELVSLENLSDLADHDALLYPVEPDGSVSDRFQQVLDSEAWQALPPVRAGQLLPVSHTSGATYRQAIRALDSLADALDALPEP